MKFLKFPGKYVSLAIILFCIITGYGFCTQPQDNQADCPNNDLTPPCPPRACCRRGTGGAQGNPLGSLPNLPVMGSGFEPNIQSPASTHTGGEAYSRTATSGPGASGVVGGIISTKKIVAQTEKILDLGGKGSLPLLINLYYASYRPTFTDNKNGDTPLGPGWVLNYHMRLEDAIGNDNLLFRTATGHQIALINTDTNTWQSRWTWTPLTVTVVKYQNDPEYGTFYKMTYDDNLTEYGFHQFGRILYQKDPNGNMLTFSYDSTGKKLNRIDFDHATNDTDNRYVTFTYTDISNLTRLTQIKASDDREWAFEYDQNAKVRLIRIKYRKSSSSSWHTLREYVYQSSDDYRITDMKATRGDDTFGTMISYVYNPLDVTEMKDLNGNTLVSLSYYYNSLVTLNFPTGAMVKIHSYSFRHPGGIEYYVDSEEVASRDFKYRWYDLFMDTSIISSTEDAAGNITYYDYYGDIEDEFDFGNTHLKKITFPDDSFITYTYDTNGNVISHKDNMGNITDYTYDSNNNLTSVTDPLNNTITYTYNTFGMLSSVTLPLDQTTTYTYNDFGMISMITHPDNLTTSYQYDTYGNLSCITDTNHRETKYQDYNDFGQPQKIIDSESNETIITYNSAGLKSSVCDANGNYTYFYYDKNYRLIEVKNKKTTPRIIPITPWVILQNLPMPGQRKPIILMMNSTGFTRRPIP
jgi:YD repeat-containing protein